MSAIVLLKISVAALTGEPCPVCAPFSLLLVSVTTLGKLLKNLNLTGLIARATGF